MTSADHRNGTGSGAQYAALGWIKETLEERYLQLRSALEDSAEDLSTDDYLDRAVALLGEISDVLNLLDTQGGVMLAEAMRAAAEAVRDDKRIDREEGLSVLMQSSVVLPGYLERLEAGGQDLPMLVLAQVNELRALRDEPLLSEGGLFAPETEPLEALLPEPDPWSGDERKDAIRKQRSIIENALAEWLGEHKRDALQPCIEASKALASGLKRKEHRELFWVNAATVEGLVAGSVDDGVATRKLLARTHIFLKPIMDEADADDTLEQSLALTRGLLFQLALAEPGIASIDDICTQLNLRELVPDRDLLDLARSSVQGRDREVFQAVNTAIQDDLEDAKEKLDLAQRTGELAEAERDQLFERLGNVADTLTMVGLGSLAERLRQRLTESEVGSETSLAEDVLRIEHALDEHAATLGESQGDVAEGEAMLPAFELRRVRSQLFSEGLTGLVKAQDAILKALESGETDHVNSAVAELAQIAGALGMIQARGSERVAQLAGWMEPALSVDEPKAETLDTLADAMTAFERNLAARRDGMADADVYLEIFEQRVEQLAGPLRTESEAVVEDEKAVSADSAEEAPDPDQTPQEPPAEAVADTDAAPDIDPEMLEIFSEEASAVRASMEEHVPVWLENTSDEAALTEIRRGFHTLKGSGRMIGADEIGHWAWAVEDLLNRVIDGSQDADREVQSLTTMAVALLPSLESRLQGESGVYGPELAAEHQAQIKAKTQGGEVDLSGLQALLEKVPEAAEEVVADDADSDVDHTLLALIRKELSEHLATLQAFAEKAGDDRRRGRPGDSEVMAAHTIAGSLALAPVADEVGVAHELESLLNAQVDWGKPLSEEALVALNQALALFATRLDSLDDEEIAEGAGLESNGLASLLREERHRLESQAEEAQDDGAEQHAAAEAEPEPEPEAQPPESGLDELVLLFLEEAEDILARCDSLVQAWLESLNDRQLISGLLRELHTLKGSARMAGFAGVGDFAHGMETVLEEVASNNKAASEGLVEAVQAGFDELHRQMDRLRAGDDVNTEAALAKFMDQVSAVDDGAVEDDAEALVEDQAADGAPAAGADEATATGRAIRIMPETLDTLVNYAGEISIYRSRMEQMMSDFRFSLSEVEGTVARLRDQLRKMDLETENQILSRYQDEVGSGAADFDPLELDRFSTIQQLSRSLNESMADLSSLQDMLDDTARKSETLLLQQSRVTTELQEGLMQTRMVPFHSLKPRLGRIVRQTASEENKQVALELELTGGGGELDRNVLERITPPLEHMLRNSVVHGIEKPSQRKKLNKPEEGTIRIHVASEATELSIRVTDDGAGIDTAAIRKKAIKDGRLKKNAKVTDEELIQMIFESGLSTAKKVTRLAGRGVGMDVVSNEIKQIGGSVDVSSEAGKGSRFELRIPFTLAVMPVIFVTAGERQFAIPLASVRGVTRVPAGDFKQLMDKKNPQHEFAGESYPVVRLGTQLGFDPEPLGDETVSLLMVRAGDQRAALYVTEMGDHREVVIKPVGPQVNSISGILGGTITGDGQVVLILDTGPLIRRSISAKRRPEEAQPRVEPEIHRQPLVMVVDDSITMRKVTSRVLEGQNLEVITARDGLDAIERMLERVPDVILLDIEMPRMDGFELAEHVRSDPRLQQIPIMMITSRSGEKHRTRATQAGANLYLTKPYQETELVGNVRSLLSMAEERRQESGE